MSSIGNNAETAFHIAAQNGHVGILELFKDYVRSVDAPRTAKELTALHVAIAAGQVKVVRWLVDNGANVNSNMYFTEKPLVVAAESGDETIVRILLEHGAMVLDSGPYGFRGPALARAAVLEETTILKLLLEHMRGDRIRHEDKREPIVDALHDAVLRRRTAAVGILEEELKLYPKRKTEVHFEE